MTQIEGKLALKRTLGSLIILGLLIANVVVGIVRSNGEQAILAFVAAWWYICFYGARAKGEELSRRLAETENRVATWRPY